MPEVVALVDNPLGTGAVDTPQCSAPVKDPPGAQLPDWRRRRYEASGLDWTRCVRHSTVTVDGQCFCALHGGRRLLALALERGA